MSEEKKRLGKVFLNGVITENPTFRLVLGTCPTQLRQLSRGRDLRGSVHEHPDAVPVQVDREQAVWRCKGMKNTQEIRKSIVVLVVICLLTSAALAVVNHFTAPVSAANAAAR